jgi:phage shock protein A
VGVLSRFTNYIRTVMSHMLDRAEDPGQALDYSYEKQLEQLQRLRGSFADVVTSKKRLELQEAQLNTQIAKYDDQARVALSQGREDLARLALERKQGLQTQIATFDQQIEQLNAQQQKIDLLQQRLTARVEQFRTQKEMVKAQYGAAQAQVQIQETATGISEDMQDVNLAVQRAQDKVLSMQARANALDELTDSGSLPEIGSTGGDDIDRQLAAVANQSAVDQQLAAMKAQLQLPSPQQGQAQLPPAGGTSQN